MSVEQAIHELQEQLQRVSAGHQAIGCANARAGRKQAVDHSEQCPSRMEATLGHERQERARDRFALTAKEWEDEEPQRKRHRREDELVAASRAISTGCSKQLPGRRQQ